MPFLPAHQLNGVPICMYFATHFYLSFYHALANKVLRIFIEQYAANACRTAFLIALVITMSYSFAFLETFSIATFPYLSFEDRGQMYSRGSAFFTQVHKMEEGLQTLKEGVSMKDTVQEINKQMAVLREEKKGIQAKLTEIREARNAKLGDMPEIIKERDELSQLVTEKVKEKNQLRDDFKAAEKAYYAYMAEVRKIRQEKQQEERMAWQKERDQSNKLAKAEKLEEQPYVAEITLIEQTLFFCKSLTKTKGGEVKEEKKETVHDNPEGTEVLSKKGDRDEEFYFAPTKGKKTQSKNKEGKIEVSKKPIKHNAETFRLFDQLKLDAPITTEEIPELVEKLEVQLAEYLQKVKVWEVTKEEKKRRILEGLDDEEEKPAKVEESEKEPEKEEAKDDDEEEKPAKVEESEKEPEKEEAKEDDKEEE